MNAIGLPPWMLLSIRDVMCIGTFGFAGQKATIIQRQRPSGISGIYAVTFAHRGGSSEGQGIGGVNGAKSQTL
jgi:hypothetical protein